MSYESILIFEPTDASSVTSSHWPKSVWSYTLFDATVTERRHFQHPRVFTHTTSKKIFSINFCFSPRSQPPQSVPYLGETPRWAYDKTAIFGRCETLCRDRNRNSLCMRRLVRTCRHASRTKRTFCARPKPLTPLVLLGDVTERYPLSLYYKIRPK